MGYESTPPRLVWSTQVIPLSRWVSHVGKHNQKFGINSRMFFRLFYVGAEASDVSSKIRDSQIGFSIMWELSELPSTMPSVLSASPRVSKLIKLAESRIDDTGCCLLSRLRLKMPKNLLLSAEFSVYDCVQHPSLSFSRQFCNLWESQMLRVPRKDFDLSTVCRKRRSSLPYGCWMEFHCSFLIKMGTKLCCMATFARLLHKNDDDVFLRKMLRGQEISYVTQTYIPVLADRQQGSSLSPVVHLDSTSHQFHVPISCQSTHTQSNCQMHDAKVVQGSEKNHYRFHHYCQALRYRLISRRSPMAFS